MVDAGGRLGLDDVGGGLALDAAGVADQSGMDFELIVIELGVVGGGSNEAGAEAVLVRLPMHTAIPSKLAFNKKILPLLLLPITWLSLPKSGQWQLVKGGTLTQRFINPIMYFEQSARHLIR